MQQKVNIIDRINSALESAAEWAGKNLNLVLGIFVAFIVLGAVATGIHYKNQSEETKALGAYAQLEKEYSDWKAGQAPNQNPETPPPPKVDTEALFAKIVGFINVHGDTKASRLAVLMASELAQTLNKESEMLSLVNDKLESSGKSLLDGLTLMKKGDWLADNDKCDEALGTWKVVISQKKAWPYLQDFAHLKSGLCSEKLSQFAEAENHYDQVISAQETQKERWAYKQAQKLKRSLRWSQKQQGS